MPEVVFFTAVTGEVMIYSVPRFDQQTSFSRFGAFFPDQINGPLDKAEAKSLYLNERLDALIAGGTVNLPSLRTTLSGGDGAANVGCGGCLLCRSFNP